MVLMVGLLPTMVKPNSTAPTEVSMLATKAALKSYASSHLDAGMVYVWSQGMTYSSNIKPYIEVQTNAFNPSVMLSALAAQSVSYALKRPSNDTLQAACYLRDQNYNIIFAGSSPTFQMVQRPDGSWTTPSNILKFGVGYVAEKVSIPFGEGAIGVQLEKKDQYGRTIDWLWLEADQNGRVSVPTSWAGAGDLTAYYDHGLPVVYNLQDGGRRINSSVQTANFTPSITDIMEVSENLGQVVINPVSHNGYGSAKIAQITVSFDRWVLCSGLTSEGEKANCVVVRSLDNNETSFHQSPAGQYSTQVLLKKGTYHVIMIWSNGFDTRADQDPTVDNSGKG